MKSFLLVTDIFPPDIGGPASFIDRLGHSLAASGGKVTVICASDAPGDPSDASRPFRVLRIRRSDKGFKFRLYRLLCLELLRHDRVLVNGLEYPAHRAAKLCRKAYVMKIVGDYAWEFARNTSVTSLGIDEFQKHESSHPEVRRMRERRKLYLAGAADVITPSEYLRGMVIGWGLDPDRVRTILNGVPLDHYAAAVPRRRAAGERLEVAFAGRLANWKGVETLLLAVHGLSDPGALRVHILGDGPEGPLLAGLSRQLGLDGSVIFHGRVPPKEIPGWLAKTHALVLVSDYEGLSHTLIEACAAGLACIASDHGGNPEVIRDGDTGLLVPYGDPPALTRALARLIADEDLRFALAARAKSGSARFDFARTVERTVELLART
ncbi:MAG: glycosyltransferase family 4 protein [Fibrobacteria bacterium]